ncbi:hypothetical protein OESDEN_19417 [Oesophagostomum dentatum]|uniref:Beta-galactosidase 1-like first all-beta domain-containing protein n=1 Tax=Oesophagostomum dentatum TaxID=61180 RepID=A0A0B1S6D2_OESDE|nr:hypothetical protein OESDEN_19417 [Oesophagostomum dentatum]
MTENGDYNDKYKTIRDFISGIRGWSHPPQALPTRPATFAQSGITLKKIGNWFDFEAQTINASRCVQNPVAKTFEELNQAMGFVKYSIVLNIGGSVLDGSGIRDFGYVFVNKKFQPAFRAPQAERVEVIAEAERPAIIVENQGRQTWETIKDYKVRFLFKGRKF